MRGRHRKPPAVPRWLAAMGLGAAVMMIGSLALATPSTPTVGMKAEVALPTFTPDPPVEPLVIPPVPVVDTPTTASRARRVPVSTTHSVDTTSKRARRPVVESDRTTSKPKPTTSKTTTTKTTTTKAATSKTTTTTATTTKPTPTTTTKEKAKPVALAMCGGGSLEGTTSSVSAAGRQIMAATGFSGTVQGRVRREGSTSDHPSGRALDFMTGDGAAILSYVRGHFGELGATYAIYRRTYYPARGGPKKMEDRGGETANHMDHVHVSFGAGGGPSC